MLADSLYKQHSRQVNTVAFILQGLLDDTPWFYVSRENREANVCYQCFGLLVSALNFPSSPYNHCQPLHDTEESVITMLSADGHLSLKVRFSCHIEIWSAVYSMQCQLDWSFINADAVMFPRRESIFLEIFLLHLPGKTHLIVVFSVCFVIQNFYQLLLSTDSITVAFFLV